MTEKIGVPCYPPGPIESPVRQSLRYFNDPVHFMLECREKYGRTFTIRLYQMPPWIYTCDEELVKLVLSDARFQAGPAYRQAQLDSVLGTSSLLCLDGKEHSELRQIGLSALNPIKKLFLERSAAEVQKSFVRIPRGSTVNLHQLYQEMGIRSVISSVTDLDHSDQERLAFLVLKLLSTQSSLVRFIVQRQRLLREIDALIKVEISRARTRNTEGYTGALLRSLDGLDTTASDVVVRDQLVTTIVAGHDSGATLLTWASYQYLKHRERYQELFLEDNRYPRRFLAEVARLYPISIGLHRVANLDVGESLPLSEFEITDGMVIAPSMLLMHREKREQLTCPHRFDPDNQSDELGFPHYFPFGAGEHQCIGRDVGLAHARTALAEFVRRDFRAVVLNAEVKSVRRGIAIVPAGGVFARRFDGY